MRSRKSASYVYFEGDSAAETRCGVDHALQDRVQVELGAADDAQQLGRCSLLLHSVSSRVRNATFVSRPASGGTASMHGLWPVVAL
jgi:hypothetical protein